MDENYVGRCAVCGDPVYRCDDRYQFPDFEGEEVIHEDCLYAWANKYFLECGT